VVKQFSDWLRDHNGPEAIQYWKQWWQLSNTIWESINWDALAITCKEVTSTKCRWASKWNSGNFSHGKNMTRWHFHTSLACPWCGHEPEDNYHIIQCPAPEVEKAWEDSLKQLQVWLHSQQTYWLITDTIIQGLSAWHCLPNAGTNTDFGANGWCNQNHIS